MWYHSAMTTIHRREYMRQYQRKWIAKRRRVWIRTRGPCVECGSKRKLEVDHINPEEKVYEVANIWGLSKEKQEAELAKCQVLCHKCHAKKSARERHESGQYDAMRIKAPEGMAWCYRKRHFASIVEFSKNKAKFDGRQDECRTCRSEKRSPKKIA
jgi:hypothetical protein